MNDGKEAQEAAAEAPAAEKSKKLSFMEKCGVGTGGLTIFLGNNSVNALAMPFYNMILGVSSSLVGLALMIPRIWDAFTDPIMGNITDNFRSKFGRRRPFIILGAVLMGLTFGSIWMVPVAWGDHAKVAWFIVTNLLFYTAFTIFSVPFVSLTYEMSPDYDERTSVQGYVTFWSKAGELLYQAVIPLATLIMSWKYMKDGGDLLDGEKIEGIRIVTATYAALGMAVFGSLPAIFGKERYYELSLKERGEEKASILQNIRQAFTSKPFILLCTLSVATMFAGMFASCMDYYLLVYYMFDGDIAEGSTWKLIVTIGYAVMGFIGIPFIVWVCKKFTKLQALQFVYALMILNAVLRWFIFQPGNQYWIWLDPLTGGLFWIGVGTVMQAMMADVCDDDELRNTRRREGMFGAIFWWSTKLAIALSWGFAGVLLGWIGFDSQADATWTHGTFLNMRLSMCLGAAIPALGCFVLMMFYPLTKKKADENRRLLEERRGEV
jgi:GPH family glycoside/pentoside/hexuronide:cation symporter